MLINAIFWEIMLPRIKDTYWIKYISTGIDPGVFGAKFGIHLDPNFGWGLSLKEPELFDVFFLYICLPTYGWIRNFLYLQDFPGFLY